MPSTSAPRVPARVAPTDRWSWRETLSVLTFILGSLGVSAAIIVWDKPPEERVAPIVFFALFGLLMFLVIRYRRFEQMADAFFNAYFRFTGMLLAPFIVLFGASVLSRYALGMFPLWAQVVLFVMWAILLAWALLLIATKQKRDGLLQSLARFNIALPIAYSFLVLGLALLFFSSVTFVMAQHGLVTFTDLTGRGVTTGSLSDFFLWHFLDAVPLLKVNDTLKWTAPLGYESAGVGWVLLLFKGTVVVPVIAAFTWYWKEKPKAAPSVA